MTTHPSDTSAAITIGLIAVFGLMLLYWPWPSASPSNEAAAPSAVSGIEQKSVSDAAKSNTQAGTSNAPLLQ